MKTSASTDTRSLFYTCPLGQNFPPSLYVTVSEELERNLAYEGMGGHFLFAIAAGPWLWPRSTFLDLSLHAFHTKIPASR